MDDSLHAAYGQLKLLADALQGVAPTPCGTFVMNMTPLDGGAPTPVLCVLVQDFSEHKSAVIPLAIMHPANEKLFADPTSDEVNEAINASMQGVIEHGGGCLCGKCARFPRDDSEDGPSPFNFN